MARTVDLRSDTVTLPSEEMYEALREAPLGDDVFREDATVNRLEALAAEKTGKEAALLVSSGTQGNIVALLAHCPRGSEVILGANCHIYNYEAGGMAALGGLIPRVLSDADGAPRPEDVAAAVRPRDVHAAPTALVCLESTHNRAGGVAVPLERMRAIKAVAREHGFPVHLDGARVFNAAQALGVDAREVTQHVDTLTFCLTKGLSCPVGSLVCGPADFIDRARKYRKMLGSGMRQAGWIAAAGVVALERLIPRLAEDHANARRLAEGLAQIPGVSIDPAKVQSNLVFFEIPGIEGTAREFVGRLMAGGVRCNPVGDKRIDQVARAARGELVAAAPAAAGAYSR
jgi:threonine aldolase